mgnify:CR=1 FL=1
MEGFLIDERVLGNENHMNAFVNVPGYVSTPSCFLVNYKVCVIYTNCHRQFFYLFFFFIKSEPHINFDRGLRFGRHVSQNIGGLK